DAVIEGSVRRHDGLVKIDARLIDPRTDQNMWRRTLEQEEARVPEMQDGLGRAVIAALERTMRRPGVRAVDARAYDLFLQGRYQADEDVLEAFKQFRAAIDRDPNNAAARQWYALALNGQGRHEAAIAEIERARAVDPLSKSVASDAGSIYRVAGRLPEAREQLRLLVSLYPEFAEGHRQFALVHLDLGDYVNAAAELEAAVRIA